MADLVKQAKSKVNHLSYDLFLKSKEFPCLYCDLKKR